MFVKFSHLYVSLLIFVAKAKSHLAPTLLVKVRLGWKELTITDTKAYYYDTELISNYDRKKFYIQAQLILFDKFSHFYLSLLVFVAKAKSLR